MLTFSFSARIAAACAIGTALLSGFGCTPAYNWREVHGAPIAFIALFPAKPASLARQVNLDGITVTMQMTAAEVDHVTFAIGTAELPDAGSAQKALTAMKMAMVSNIAGTITNEKSSGVAATGASIDLEAADAVRHRKLFGHFVVKGRHVYQAIVVGQANAVKQEHVDTFLTSFKIGGT